MGDFDKGHVPEMEISEGHEKTILFVEIVLILGLIAPFMMTVIMYGRGTEFAIMSVFWMYNQSTALAEPHGFSLVPPYVLISMIPLMLLRFVPVYQIDRYYQGKTTRKRAFIASSAGDGIFLYAGLLPMIFSLLFSSPHFFTPLPLQSIVAVHILWRFLMPEPTSPWKTDDEPETWWDEVLDAQQESFPDDDALREYLHADDNSHQSGN